MLAIVTALLVVLAVYVFSFYQRVKRYPRGPTPLPFIGNMHQLPPKNVHEYFASLEKTYGPVFTVWVPHPTIIITDYEHIRDAYIKKGDDYLGRTGEFPDTVFQPVPNGGVIFSQGDEWKEERRNALHILRDFGMGKNLMEEQVKISMQDCIEHLRRIEDKDHVDMRWPIQLLVVNVINMTLFGYHYPYNDCERVKKFCDQLNFIFQNMRLKTLPMLAQQFPWIARLPVIGEMAVGRFFKLRETLFEHVLEDMERSLKGYTPDKEPETFTQAYMQRIQNNPTLTYSNKDFESMLLRYERLKNVCMDFFVAGSETTSTTLRWGCIFMAKYPIVQEKLRAEIYEKLGKEKLASMKDKANMPYTSATIMELQRLINLFESRRPSRVANIIAFNVLHRTTVDTTCGKHSIPAGTRVMAQISTVMSTDPHFDSPDVFRPERFLHEDGKTFKKELVDRVIPFSMGKRQCAGEGLARMELFIGLTALLQHFRIKAPLDEPLNSTPQWGSVLIPPTNYFQIEEL